jgi:hypothetical protein
MTAQPDPGNRSRQPDQRRPECRRTPGLSGQPASSVLLGGIYAGAVLVLGQLFGQVGDPPSWVIAGATLAVAALFRPARRRIQEAVDRRFNRHRYDKTKTVHQFSDRLRHHIDLDTLSTELLVVVHQTVEPTTASLWLRPADSRPVGQEPWTRQDQAQQIS